MARKSAPVNDPPVAGDVSNDVSEEDILRGFEALHGYVDITPQDFRELYIRIHTLARDRLFQRQTAKDIMTTPVFTIRQDNSIGECINLLAEKAVSGGPVVDAQGVVTGVISEKDILRLLGKQPETRLMRLIDDSTRQALYLSPELLRQSVTAAMSSPAVTAGPETNLGQLAHIFEKLAINRLPIVDAGGGALGIITRENMIRAISELV
jgi:CBS-domain-containing membrane protein